LRGDRTAAAGRERLRELSQLVQEELRELSQCLTGRKFGIDPGMAVNIDSGLSEMTGAK
jgi:hypothetical protein